MRGRAALAASRLSDEVARKLERAIEVSAFNPWNAPPEFHPLGNLMRARKHVYRAGASLRGASLSASD
jgi:hypothetical protein